MQYGLFYLLIKTHGFSVSAILDTGTTQSFFSYKLAVKLPATIQTMVPLPATLPMGKILVATMAINLDILIDDFVYT